MIMIVVINNKIIMLDVNVCVCVCVCVCTYILS